MEPRKRQELEQEALRHRGRIARIVLQGSQAPHQEQEQRDVALVLLGHPVDRLEHGLPGRDQVEVAPDP